MPSDRELEQLIDAALCSYSEREARPGLEERILTHALAEYPRRKRFHWAWALATPSAACLLLFLLFPERHNSDRSTLKAIATTAPAFALATPRGTPAITPLPSPGKRSVSRQRSAQPSTTPETLPKEDVFPSPSPLTAEEQTLVAYNRTRLRAATTRIHELDIHPIRIADLQIEPLTISIVNTPASSPSGSGRNDQ